ncbi:ribosome biogenesis protein [Trifolium repens]|nr:ribosome biogenesis protein [Trifolium repens]
MNVRLVKNDCYDYGFEVIVGGFGSVHTLSFTAMGKPNTRSDSSDSKSDRKFEKKLQFYTKVKNAVASLTAQKSISKNKSKHQRRQKKLKAYNLSSFLETLPGLKEPQKPSNEDNFKLNCKNRQTLVLKEGQRLSEFFKDHSSQVDPLAAIYQHLRSTQPEPVVEEQQPKKRPNINGSKKRKNKSKAGSGIRSMEI